MSRLVDALVVAWVLGWILLGISVGREVREGDRTIGVGTHERRVIGVG